MKKNKIFGFFFSMFFFFPAHSLCIAQEKHMVLVRDAQIESLVYSYTKPIFKAAGLPSSQIEISLIHDDHFNAFVSNGRRLFIHTGAILFTETPNQIIGVIAHEVGHLAGGHLQRLEVEYDRANSLRTAGMLIAIGGGLLAVNSSSQNESAENINNKAQAIAGLGMGISEFGQRSFLYYRRTEEATADQSALRYLKITNQSPRGFLEILEKLRRDSSLAESSRYSYLSTHPAAEERIAYFQTKAKESAHFNKKDSQKLQRLHDLVRIKIAFYTQGKEKARRMKKSFSDPWIGRYADCLDALLSGKIKESLIKLDSLIREEPKNPYLYELRGDALMKGNNPSAAIQSYEKAASLDSSALIKASLGHALLLKGDEASLKKAIFVLKEAIARDKKFVSSYHYLSQVFAKRGENSKADLAIANRYYYSGNVEEAKKFARRAQSAFKKNSKDWLEARDILAKKKNI